MDRYTFIKTIAGTPALIYYSAAISALASKGFNESESNSVVDIDSRLELLVDDYLIDTVSGDASLRLHNPVPREVSLIFDKQWETKAPGYVTVFQEGDIYRMYYRATRDVEGAWEEKEFACYAESNDGIHWIRPELGLFEFQGSKKNNIIWRGVFAHNFTPFRDGNPDCLFDQKYKAVGGVSSKYITTDIDLELWALVSPDGIHWQKLSDEPLPLKGNFDSQNVIFWDSVTKEYRAYWRDHRQNDPRIPDGRDVRFATSKDLIHWSKGQWLDYKPGRRGTADRTFDSHQFYTNGVQPYYRAPHLLLGFPMRYIDRGWTASTDDLPNAVRRRELSAKKATGGRPTREGTAVTDVMFMVSRDGQQFYVWPEAIIPPGIQRNGAWFYGNGSKALGMVETESEFDGAPRELSVYVDENARQDTPQRLRRYTFRMDGFGSVHASLKGGQFITRPLLFTGNRLEINFATSAGGSLFVELQNKYGKPIHGFTLADCNMQYGDQLDRIVSWKLGVDVSKLAGKPVQMRFELKDADLYSFRFIRK